MMNHPLYLVSTNSGNTNLAPSVIDAENDIDAMRTWLIARGTRSINTLDAYKREAVRFLTWLNENQITMREMSIADVHRYMDHLRSPPAHWIRPKKTKRGTKLKPTQLMSGPLSERSVAYARTVLTQLFGYLHDAGYLPRNPVKLSSRPAVIVQSEQHRFLDVESWEWLWNWVCMTQGKNREQVAWSARARWLLALLYHTGIRRSEAASAMMGDFVRNDQSWTLRVIGKGLKERNITVNSALLEELRIYRLRRGCQTALPCPDEKLPLVTSIRSRASSQCMTGRGIGKVISDIFSRASRECQDAHIHSRLVQASTHWLRHTNATHRLRAGASLATTQDELGHADPKTTRIYAASMSEERIEDAEKLARISSTSKATAVEKL